MRERRNTWSNFTNVTKVFSSTGYKMFKIVLPVYCSAGRIQSIPDPLLHVDIPRHLH